MKKTKKKLTELKQIDGKEEKFVPSTLAQVLGDTGLDKYKTSDKEVYKNQINAMNLADLRRHAIKIGILPNMQRERLVKQLLVEFNKHYNLYRKPASDITHPKDMNSSDLKKALDIMSAVK